MRNSQNQYQQSYLIREIVYPYHARQLCAIAQAMISGGDCQSCWRFDSGLVSADASTSRAILRSGSARLSACQLKACASAGVGEFELFRGGFKNLLSTLIPFLWFARYDGCGGATSTDRGHIVVGCRRDQPRRRSGPLKASVACLTGDQSCADQCPLCGSFVSC